MAELEDPEMRRQVHSRLKNKGRLGSALALKLSAPLHWRPFGILVREVASDAAELRQHDYMAMPEIIEDLCDDVSSPYGTDLLPIFQAKWRPALVKFTRPPAGDGRVELQTALSYARSKFTEGKPRRYWVYRGCWASSVVKPGNP